MFRAVNEGSFKLFPDVRAVDFGLEFVVVLEVTHALTDALFKLTAVDVVSRSAVLGDRVEAHGPPGDHCSGSVAVVRYLGPVIHFYSLQKVVLSFLPATFLSVDVHSPSFNYIDPLLKLRLVQKLVWRYENVLNFAGD